MKSVLIIAVLLGVAGIVVLLWERAADKRTIDRQAGRILELLIERDEMQKEMALLRARVKAERNHQDNLRDWRLDEAMEAIAELERRGRIKDRMIRAMDRRGA